MMALPDNAHHVHSDGYTSDRGEPDRGRMLREIGDEIEQIQGVEHVFVEDEYMEIEYDEQDSTRDTIGDVIESWDCRITNGYGETIEVRLS